MSTDPRYQGTRHTVLWNLRQGTWHNIYSESLFTSEVFTVAARCRFMIGLGMCLGAGLLERDDDGDASCYWVRITEAGRAMLERLDRIG